MGVRRLVYTAGHGDQKYQRPTSHYLGTLYVTRLQEKELETLLFYIQRWKDASSRLEDQELPLLEKSALQSSLHWSTIMLRDIKRQNELPQRTFGRFSPTYQNTLSSLLKDLTHIIP